MVGVCMTLPETPQVKGVLDKGGVLMAKTGGYLANVRSLHANS